MPFSQAKSYSQPASQPCSSRDPGGESKPNQAPIPGFSHQQSVSIRGLMTAFQIALDQSFDQHFGPVQQPSPSPPTPPPTQPNSLAKKKRNQKTRNQYKKKAQSQAQGVSMVQVQEVDRSQEVDSLQISVEKEASKHVFLQYIWECCWHAVVISYVGMTSLNGMIMVQNGTIWTPRMGVG